MSGAIEKCIDTSVLLDSAKNEARAELVGISAELTSLHVDNARLREAVKDLLLWEQVPSVSVRESAEYEDALEQGRNALSGSPAGAFVSLAELEDAYHDVHEAYVKHADDNETFHQLAKPLKWLARKMETARGL